MRILVLERFENSALASLRAEFEKVDFHKSLPGSGLEDVVGLIIRSKTQVNEKLLARMPQLKCVVTATSGFDHIDWRTCQGKGICVMYCPEGNARAAAEHAWALLLSCVRKLPAARSEFEKSRWSRDALMGTELSGKTLGVVGLGRVGSLVAEFANAFAMNVVYHDPFIEPSTAPAGCEALGFIELLRSSDVISLHVPLTEKTHHLINHQTLEHLNEGAILINNSRGPVVSENALIDALEKGRLAAAGLDVFEREPLATDSRLRRMDQLVCSPHIGGTTIEAFARVSASAAGKVVNFFKNGTSSDSLPGSIPWLES